MTSIDEGNSIDVKQVSINAQFSSRDNLDPGANSSDINALHLQKHE
jgi:hypothetical protein